MNKTLKWILIAVGGLVVVFVVAPFVLGMLSGVNPKKSVEMAKQAGEGFDMVENASYIFYYPKGYTKAAATNNEVLNYENANTQAVEPESIFLKVEPSSRRLPSPTFESCKKAGESFRIKEDDEITVEVAFGGLGEGEGKGCKIVAVSDIEGVNDAGVIIEKTLWYDKGDDLSIYRARAIYYENASSSEAERLNLAVDQFALK